MPPLPPARPSLLLATAYLVWQAQRVRHCGVLTTWEQLAALPRPQQTYEPALVQRSVLFVCALAGRLGLLNSCLVRALVTARLLRGHDRVVLHIGIDSRATGHTPEGHAWVELAGDNISDPLQQLLPPQIRITHSIHLSNGD